MKEITLANISDIDHDRIHNALTKAYNVETCEEAVAIFIKSTVKSVEESAIMQAKDKERETEVEALSELEL